MPDVTCIHHVSLLVSDTGRAVTFYSDVLGLKVDRTRPELGYPGAWLGVPGAPAAQIHLLELPDPLRGTARPGHGGRDRHVALGVTDLDEVQVALGDAGIEYSLSRSGRRALFCCDPDGNAIELLEISTES